MVYFHTVYALCSDGRNKINGLDNVPSKDQQQQSEKKVGGKTVIDYYRALQKTDGKYIDWLQKLACMVVREELPQDWEVISANPQVSYIMHDFPPGFSLWEHIKKTNDSEGQQITKTKSHAAGGHDRMDAYLYGHPSKKRYRSPAEFFPHLYWLMTDDSKNRDNCRCVCCCPDALQPMAQTTKLESGTKNKIQANPVAKKLATTKVQSQPQSQPQPQPQPQAISSVSVVAPRLSPAVSSQFVNMDAKNTSKPTSKVTINAQTKSTNLNRAINSSQPTSTTPNAITQKPAGPHVHQSQSLGHSYAQSQPTTQQQGESQNRSQNQLPMVYGLQHQEYQAPSYSTQPGSHQSPYQMTQMDIQNQQSHGNVENQFNHSSATNFQYNDATQMLYGQPQHDFSMMGHDQRFGDFGMDFNSSDFSGQPAESQALMDDLNNYINMNGDYQNFGT